MPEYELIVRKRISSFLEKMLRTLGYDFRHDIYKQVIYGEIPYNTEFEKKFKNYYDSFMYLLHNKKSPFTSDLLDKFIMLFNNSKITDDMNLRIVSKIFYLNNDDIIKCATDFHIYIYKEFNHFPSDERLIISLMFFNYVLVKNNIPCIQILKSEFDIYFKYKEKYLNNNKQGLYSFFGNLIKKSKFQLKEFKENLREIKIDDVTYKFILDKTKLQEEYKIKEIYLFGSFAKDTTRIDSDIDVMILFDENILYDKKNKILDELKEEYEKYFNRYLDFFEVNKYITDEIIKEYTKLIKVF